MPSQERTRAACLKSAFDDMPEFRDSYMGGAIRNAIIEIEAGKADVALTLLHTVKERMGL